MKYAIARPVTTEVNEGPVVGNKALRSIVVVHMAVVVLPRGDYRGICPNFHRGVPAGAPYDV